ncbi:predicted protein [Nematostella vectensis]|uniref:SET domain-containing protein n=1 Tax=Nematostella vectensis TaxID=45351 RepID=A7SSW0_NEMVE|nr:SET domain-containing protein 4 [Nematostella vectensis]EDO33223.1 predicted protein [Nematostella vectensis]|eukprot:XP_001625323.1 predicted protein [Nematostella vectensis]
MAGFVSYHEFITNNLRMGKPGRTQRKRLRQKRMNISGSNLKPQVLLEENYISLLKWAKRNGMVFKKIRPAIFSSTGRGMLAIERIHSSECVISVPERLLITASSVLESAIGNYVAERMKGGAKSSNDYLLVLFLMYEKYLEKGSFWAPYIRTLPDTFNTPCYFTRKELFLLPEQCREQAFEQVTQIKQSYKSFAKAYNDVLQDFDCNFWRTVDFESFKWAWCVVNTRSVYHDEPNRRAQPIDGNCALAPLLDLLNHCDKAEMCGRFNSSSKNYEINVITEYQKGTQVFINYGPHDNTRLFLEYGFVLPRNVHNSYRFTRSTILSHLGMSNSFLSNAKEELIERNSLTRDLSCVSSEGISWNLWTFLGVLALPEAIVSQWDMILSNKCPDKLKGKIEMWARLLLQRELSDLVTYNSGLQDIDPSDNSRLALHLRQDQIDILKESLLLL